MDELEVDVSRRLEAEVLLIEVGMRVRAEPLLKMSNEKNANSEVI